MAEETKKGKSLVYILLAVFGAPFIMTVVKLFQKGPEEPVTMQDLFAIFGMQLLLLGLALIYLLFFHYVPSIAVLG